MKKLYRPIRPVKIIKTQEDLIEVLRQIADDREVSARLEKLLAETESRLFPEKTKNH